MTGADKGLHAVPRAAYSDVVEAVRDLVLGPPADRFPLFGAARHGPAARRPSRPGAPRGGAGPRCGSGSPPTAPAPHAPVSCARPRVPRCRASSRCCARSPRRSAAASTGPPSSGTWPNGSRALRTSRPRSAMLVLWDGIQMIDAEAGFAGNDELAEELLGIAPRRHVPPAAEETLLTALSDDADEDEETDL